MAGPLQGCRIVELAGIGPAPFCAMLLADMGAEVVWIDRPSRGGDLDLGIPLPRRYSVLLRSRRSARVDLKDPAGVEVVLCLVEASDALIEGFRPGVAERLGGARARPQPGPPHLRGDLLVVQPGPAPRFGRTPPEIQGPPCSPGAHTPEVLADWAIPADEIDRLVEQGTVA